MNGWQQSQLTWWSCELEGRKMTDGLTLTPFLFMRIFMATHLYYSLMNVTLNS
jgi:hypothetical protein